MRNVNDYSAVMSRKKEIILNSVGIDYTKFESGSIAFDYERMMYETSYRLEKMRTIQHGLNVRSTQIIELKNLTELTRRCAHEGKGARIFIRDEATNQPGIFKARRAANAIYHAKRLGYKGVIAATAGNYSVALAAQAAMAGLKCVIVQECYDSKGVGRPEIIERARKCEALGAEVLQLSVGPELFCKFLLLLEETGYFNASLYSPFSIAGVEVTGYEMAMQFRQNYGKDPEALICSNIGGGNLTGTARGLAKAGAKPAIIGASVNLTGIHMASDRHFNKRSFTAGHISFDMPFSSWPERPEVPRSAARPLRYMDRYVTVTQGEIFYITEVLAGLEGLERGPAGNIALTAAFSIAQEMDQDQMILAQGIEHTSTGRHTQSQISFAKDNGIEVTLGDPREEVPGENIVLPADPSLIRVKEVDMSQMRTSLIKTALRTYQAEPTEEDIAFLAAETKMDIGFVKEVLRCFKEERQK